MTQGHIEWTRSSFDPILVIEHMEEDMFEWSIKEYSHVLNHVNPKNLLLTGLPRSMEKVPDCDSLKCTHTTLAELIGSGSVSLAEICLLDSEAKDTLSPSDAPNFKYFVAGGILGNVDDFDMDRTSELRVLGMSTRNLGAQQMTLDTAVLVAHKILFQNQTMDSLRFVDHPEFVINKHERLLMPFRYLEDEISGEPLMAPGVLEILSRDNDLVL